jgi:hypothetical protein
MEMNIICGVLFVLVLFIIYKFGVLSIQKDRESEKEKMHFDFQEKVLKEKEKRYYCDLIINFYQSLDKDDKKSFSNEVFDELKSQKMKV